jgi:hypothetical protein
MKAYELGLDPNDDELLLSAEEYLPDHSYVAVAEGQGGEEGRAPAGYFYTLLT